MAKATNGNGHGPQNGSHKKEALAAAEKAVAEKAAWVTESDAPPCHECGASVQRVETRWQLDDESNWRCSKPNQSSRRMWRALASALQRAMSSSMNLPNCSGDSGITVSASLASRCCSAGEVMALLISAFTRMDSSTFPSCHTNTFRMRARL